MPNKRASLFFMLPKNPPDAEIAFWRPFINRLEEGTYTELETPSVVVLGLQAKNYELIDHQFVRVTLNVEFQKTKGEMVILLPRQHVLAIIEGKSVPLEGFSVTSPKES